MKTLQNLHYGISKILERRSEISYQSPINPCRKLTHILVPQVKSQETNRKRTKLIKNVIDSCANDDNNDSNDLIDKVLNMIDINYNDNFFNCTVKSGYCLKKVNVMSAMY